MSHKKHPHEQGPDGPDGQPQEGAPGPVPAEKAPAVEDPLAAKTRECRDLVDSLQRLGAEYANYQKRMARMMEDAEKQAGRDLVMDLLPVIDNFERALASAKGEADFKALRNGVQLVHDQVLAVLAKHGVTQVAAHGEEFNPEHHEAVAQLPSGEHEAGKVAEVVQKGYKMDGRTIRASRVVISSGPPAKPDAKPDLADEEPLEEGNA
jgi:molecular chaperone GrpE